MEIDRFRFHTIIFHPEEGDFGFGYFTTEFADETGGNYHPASLTDREQVKAIGTKHKASHHSGIYIASTNSTLPEGIQEKDTTHYYKK